MPNITPTELGRLVLAGAICSIFIALPTWLVNLLDSYSKRATFFINSSTSATKNEAIVKYLEEAGAGAFVEKFEGAFDEVNDHIENMRN